MAFSKLQSCLSVMRFKKRSFSLHHRPQTSIPQPSMHSVDRDVLVGNVPQLFSDLYCIISLAHTNNSFSMTNISRGELLRMASRVDRKVGTVFGANETDSASRYPSFSMDLLARHARVE